MKANLITWLVLISLTVTGYFFSGSTRSGSALALLILTLFGIKFLSIGYQFMELKKAHPAWKTLLPVIIFVFITFITIAYKT
jgi:lipopolysaccharide export LptBFGC system permease protein LptF